MHLARTLLTLFRASFDPGAERPRESLFRLFLFFEFSREGQQRRNNSGQQIVGVWLAKMSCRGGAKTTNCFNRSSLTPTLDLPPTSALYRHTRNCYLSNSKTFQDGNGNGTFGELTILFKIITFLNSKTISLCNCNCNYRKIIPRTIF